MGLGKEARERRLSPEGSEHHELSLRSVDKVVILSGNPNATHFSETYFCPGPSILLQIFIPPQQIFHVANEK